MQRFLTFDEVDQYGPQQGSRTLSISGEEFGREEVERFDRVEIEALASRGNLEGEYVLEGKVDASGLLRCSRCLEPFPFANNSSFRVRYLPSSQGPDKAEEEVEIGQADLEVEYYDDRKVELGELAAEQLQLSIPMKLLCGEACFGLCAHCGSNLNQQKCSCSAAEQDPRWEALRGIREELSKEKE